MSLVPVRPDYGGGCVSNLVPALVQHADAGRGWIPDAVLDAHQTVLLVIDGLGWHQLQKRLHLVPTLAGMEAAPITTVAPTTTATALTSIATGTTPGEHGVVGYKMWVGGEVLNTLRWASAQGDARQRLDPAEIQPLAPFLGTSPRVISKADFRETGFTLAHLRDTRYTPYWVASSVPVEIAAALAAGDRFTYAYYDGIDKIAHITGLGAHYDAELMCVDDMVAKILERLPSGAALVVTADHGQVQVGENTIVLDPSVASLTSNVSGEPRFVWLHATGGQRDELLAATAEAHGDIGWVWGVEQVLDEGWFGRAVSPQARARLGDVAIAMHQPTAIVDERRPGPALQSRHGSVTAAEMRVPLLTAVG